MTTTATASSTRRAPLIGVLLLGVVGLAVSAELARLHYRVHTDPAYQSWCRVGETVNCEAVERSGYAVFAGVPVAAWGLLGYLVLLGTALTGLGARPHQTWPRGALLAISVLFTLVSIENAFVSFVLLGAVCLMCAASYAVNLLLLGITLFFARAQGTGLRAVIGADLRALLRRWPWSAAAACAVIGAAALAVLLYPRYWERTPQLPGGPAKLSTGLDAHGAPWIGARAPELEIIEFSDYECPFCARSHAVVRSAVAAEPERLRLVHRHFPLDLACNDLLDRPFHRHACMAARAAVCAGAQGKFWEMNDALFNAQRALAAERIQVVAGDLALDSARFNACLDAAETEETIQGDIDDAAGLEATGTPLYVIRGEVHRGAMTPLRLQQIIAATR